VDVGAFFLVVGVVVVVVGLPLAGAGWLLARWIRSKPYLAERLETMASNPPTKGYFKVMEIRGTPLLVHWSFPAGGLVLSGATGFEPRATLYFCAGYTLLILLHEVGHAAAARWLGLRVLAIEISGVGGLCRMQTAPRGLGGAFLVYSAGLLVQLVLLLLTLSYLAAFGTPSNVLASCLVLTFTFVNLFVIVVNLVPYAPRYGIPTDGYVLWKLYQHVRRHGLRVLSAAPTSSRVLPPETRLLTLSEFVPDQFVVGVEILNDNATPMEFVVEVLARYLGLDRDKAIDVVLAIHHKGGILLPLSSLAAAETVAGGITRDAREKGLSLVCRAVEAR
jgi:ATP-dependent Clp protease adapter protein ClpS/Zn-dependent protease